MKPITFRLVMGILGGIATPLSMVMCFDGLLSGSYSWAFLMLFCTLCNINNFISNFYLPYMNSKKD